MISGRELKMRMDAKPFQPFRICLSDGSRYDVANHDSMMIGKHSVVVGFNERAQKSASEPPEMFVQCSILHITRVEGKGVPDSPETAENS